MSLRINEINLQNAGPISKFTMELGDINLIYGKNEQGKTTLVEFILRRLFRQAKDFGLRESVGGEGKIVISGITPNETISFHTDSQKKLEDLLAKPLPGLPPKISRLLVVKGAELSLKGTSTNSLDITVVKEFLSNAQSLDTIQGQVSPTLQNATIEGYQLSGNQRGEIKKLNDAWDKIEEIENLYQQLNDSYSQGGVKSLMHELSQVENEISIQQRARKYFAYCLVNKIEQRNSQIAEISFDKLTPIKEVLYSYQNKVDDLENHRNTIASKQKNIDNYLWLNNALDIYKQRGKATSKFPIGISYIVVLIFLIIIAVACAFLNLPAVTAIFGGFSLILVVILFRKVSAYTTNVLETDEMYRISHEFEERFGESLKSLAQIQTVLNQLASDYNQSEFITEQISKLERELEALAKEINSELNRFGNEPPNRSNWQNLVTQLEQKRRLLEDERHKLESILYRMDMDEDEYLAEPTEQEYDDVLLKTLKTKAKDLREIIDDETRKNKELFEDVKRLTKTKNDLKWENLLEELQTFRMECLDEYQQLKAECVAKVILNEILAKLYQQEELKIKTCLQDKAVETPLYQITQRYRSISLEDQNSLMVADDFSHFAFSSLSTGAQEQILLALRIGFAAKILDQQRFFLILDDAFQHSDWNRREFLVEQTIMLAQNGWQMIYFTMDDHIRDLFKQKVKNGFKGKFVYKELV
jgi:DNA repair exonuclease SbcCD ATPase subunit